LGSSSAFPIAVPSLSKEDELANKDLRVLDREKGTYSGIEDDIQRPRSDRLRVATGSPNRRPDEAA